MTASLEFPPGRQHDVACLGRLAVDLYAQQIGCSLEEASSFSKYLGGSSANIAFGTARLGLRSAMISRVGDEQNGRFLLNTLHQEGCDISQVQTDPQRLTAMVLLGIKDQHTFPLLFARENCADMALDAQAISEDFIAGCRSLLITGTHLSTPGVLAASQRALALAKRHDVVRVLDIDYRPVLWGLTGRGDGQTRYVSSQEVSRHLQAQLPWFDLIIGTEEEWLIAGGQEELMAALRHAREHTQAVFVVKRGALGCSIIEAQVPACIDDALTVEAERIEVLNVLGAGDAFSSGLLYGLLTGKGWEESARIANACGAIVVSRHACAPAMPTQAELAHWFSGRRQARPDQDPWLAHLHRVSVARKPWPQLHVLAYDHRTQFEALAHELGADIARIPVLKQLLNGVVEQVQAGDARLQGQLGVLIDDRLGEAALHQATGRGWWVGRPIEQPGSRPLRFDRTYSLASALQHWPREHVVKCLVFYHPDDPEPLRTQQQEWLLHAWQATRSSGHELLLEVIPPRESPGDAGQATVRAVAQLYGLGLRPEWWKLGVMRAQHWQDLDELVQTNDPYCRGAVILGQSQPLQQLVEGFSQARHSRVVRGFMVGRSVWAEPSRAWLAGHISDDQLQARVAHNFGLLIDGWRASRQ